jgi:hypothetical protein
VPKIVIKFTIGELCLKLAPEHIAYIQANAAGPTIMTTNNKRQASEICDLYNPPKRANTTETSIFSLLACIEGEFQRRKKDKEDSFMKWAEEEGA